MPFFKRRQPELSNMQGKPARDSGHSEQQPKTRIKPGDIVELPGLRPGEFVSVLYVGNRLVRFERKESLADGAVMMPSSPDGIADLRPFRRTTDGKPVPLEDHERAGHVEVLEGSPRYEALEKLYGGSEGVTITITVLDEPWAEISFPRDIDQDNIVVVPCSALRKSE